MLAVICHLNSSAMLGAMLGRRGPKQRPWAYGFTGALEWAVAVNIHCSSHPCLTCLTMNECGAAVISTNISSRIVQLWSTGAVGLQFGLTSWTPRQRLQKYSRAFPVSSRGRPAQQVASLLGLSQTPGAITHNKQRVGGT